MAGMPRYDKRTFELTEDHLKLLRAAYISWDEGEYGAPAIDCKRPYGNSDVETDIAELLGWEIDEDNEYGEYLTEQQVDDARRIHKETLVALQILVQSASIRTGTYTRGSTYGNDWELNQ